MTTEHSAPPRRGGIPGAGAAPLPEPADCLSPRYWPVWIAYGLMRALASVPAPLRHVLASLLGRLAFRVARRDRRTTLVNLRLAHPDWTEARRRDLARRHFVSLALGVFETGLVWFADEKSVARITRIEGIEHLKAAAGRGKGVLLLGGHFTTNEIAAAALPQCATALSIMYKAPKDPLMHALAVRRRSGRGGRMIPADRLVDMIQALKSGGTVLYAPDQRYDLNDALTVPLFGVPALANPGPPVVARYTGCAVLPYFPLRLPDGSYLMTIGEPLDRFPSGDVAGDVARYFGLLEAAVARAPEQYLWSYKRYRPRDGEPDPYRRGVARGYTP